MIREVCSCGAEFETDDRDAVVLLKSWRRTHKHFIKPPETSGSPFQVVSDTHVGLGFQPLYTPTEHETEYGNDSVTDSDSC